jgi:hypothetical protein
MCLKIVTYLRETQTPSTGFKFYLVYIAYIYSQLLRSFKMIASFLCCMITFVCSHCSYSGLQYMDVGQRSQYSDTVTGGSTKTRFPARASTFFFASNFIIDMGTKQPAREAGHSSPSSAKNANNYLQVLVLLRGVLCNGREGWLWTAMKSF